jgi:hypothetical protein
MLIDMTLPVRTVYTVPAISTLSYTQEYLLHYLKVSACQTAPLHSRVGAIT